MKFQYAKRAEQDLQEIAEFSERQWSQVQAARYIVELDRFCGVLADNPKMGRQYIPKHPTWFRMEHASHVIYYRTQGTRILVQRILHKSRMAHLHLSL